MKIKVSKFHPGFSVITEYGNGLSGAQIICGKDGERVHPVYVPQNQSTVGPHAIFRIEEDMCVVIAAINGLQENATVYRLKLNGDEADLEPLYMYSGTKEERNPLRFVEAITTAFEKCRCYGCKEPHYIKEIINVNVEEVASP